VWPDLPIVISSSCNYLTDLDNIKAALEHHDRVCKIKLFFGVCKLEDIIASLQKPFPMLTDLELSARGFFGPFVPDPSKFLGGSARLRSLNLSGIGIPDLLNLLLSTPNLVILRLDGIRDFGSFLPDDLVTVLSTLTSLEWLSLQLRSYPEFKNRRLPLPTCTILPSLTVLEVKGTAENLEEFMARIDAPLLERLFITIYFNIMIIPELDRDIVLDTPQLFQFISRISNLQPPAEAHIVFGNGPEIWFFFPSPFHSIQLEFECVEPERQFTALAQFCRSAPFPTHTCWNPSTST
jgi:hypothetical protein